MIQEIGTVETKAGTEDKGPELFQEMGKSRSRSRSSSCVSTNRDRSRCYRCNEYDHFARECPNVMSDGRARRSYSTITSTGRANGSIRLFRVG